jgi:hypothetical protein
MATPIKETPILRGKDARRFEKVLAGKDRKPVSRADYERAVAIYNSVVRR